jgi:nitrite reductase (NADH) small subunit
MMETAMTIEAPAGTAASPDELNWVEAGPLQAIPVLGARVLRTRRGDVAIFRNREDEVFALFDRCPHKAGPLSQGIVSGRTVACPLHGWVIKLEDGCAMAPDEGTTSAFPIKLEAGMVWVGLPASYLIHSVD